MYLDITRYGRIATRQRKRYTVFEKYRNIDIYNTYQCNRDSSVYLVLASQVAFMSCKWTTWISRCVFSDTTCKPMAHNLTHSNVVCIIQLPVRFSWNVCLDFVLKGWREKRENLRLNVIMILEMCFFGMRCRTEALTSLIFIKDLMALLVVFNFYSLNKIIQ